METNLELLKQVSSRPALDAETVGVVSDIIGTKGKLEISGTSVTNGKDRMVCWLTTEKGERFQATISPAVTKDLRAKTIGKSDLGWMNVSLVSYKTGEKGLVVSYPQGSATQIEVAGTELKTTGARPAQVWSEDLLAL